MSATSDADATKSGATPRSSYSYRVFVSPGGNESRVVARRRSSASESASRASRASAPLRSIASIAFARSDSARRLSSIAPRIARVALARSDSETASVSASASRAREHAASDSRIAKRADAPESDASTDASGSVKDSPSARSSSTRASRSSSTRRLSRAISASARRRFERAEASAAECASRPPSTNPPNAQDAFETPPIFLSVNDETRDVSKTRRVARATRERAKTAAASPPNRKRAAAIMTFSTRASTRAFFFNSGRSESPATPSSRKKTPAPAPRYAAPIPRLPEPRARVHKRQRASASRATLVTRTRAFLAAASAALARRARRRPVSSTTPRHARAAEISRARRRDAANRVATSRAPPAVRAACAAQRLIARRAFRTKCLRRARFAAATACFLFSVRRRHRRIASRFSSSRDANLAASATAAFDAWSLCNANVSAIRFFSYTVSRNENAEASSARVSFSSPARSAAARALAALSNDASSRSASRRARSAATTATSYALGHLVCIAERSGRSRTSRTSGEVLL